MEENKDIIENEGLNVEAQDAELMDDAPKGKYGALILFCNRCR